MIRLTTPGPVPKPVKEEKQKKPIAKASKKRQSKEREYQKLRRAFMEKSPICQFEGCKKWATDLHHQAGRVGDNLTDPTYFLGLCRTHHQWVEMHPKEAKLLGYSVSRLTDNDREIYE